MDLLEISNTYRILHRIKPEAADVCAVHKNVQLSKEWIRTAVLPGSGLYDPDTNRYLLVGVFQSTERIEWGAARISEVMTIIAGLESEIWESDLKGLVLTVPLEDWLQLARDIGNGEYAGIITQETWLLRTRIQILLVDAGRISDEVFIASVTAE